MASRYDDEIWELVPEDRAPAPVHLRRFVSDLDPGRVALDLGCGDGTLSTELGAEHLTLADVSPVALERAGRLLPGSTRAELDPDEALPFDDGAFDLVLCAEVIEHVRDTQLLLSEVRRVLVPGGRLAVTTPAHGRGTALRILRDGFEDVFDPLSPHLRFLTQRSLGALVGAMGFDVVELRSVGGSIQALAVR